MACRLNAIGGPHFMPGRPSASRPGRTPFNQRSWSCAERPDRCFCPSGRCRPCRADPKGCGHAGCRRSSPRAFPAASRQGPVRVHRLFATVGRIEAVHHGIKIVPVLGVVQSLKRVSGHCCPSPLALRTSSRCTTYGSGAQDLWRPCADRGLNRVSTRSPRGTAEPGSQTLLASTVLSRANLGSVLEPAVAYVRRHRPSTRRACGPRGGRPGAARPGWGAVEVPAGIGRANGFANYDPGPPRT